jgi:hypothetical protein
VKLDRKNIVYVGVFVGLCLLGFFAPELHKHLPGMTATFTKLALFVVLIALLGYAKLKN